MAFVISSPSSGFSPYVLRPREVLLSPDGLVDSGMRDGLLVNDTLRAVRCCPAAVFAILVSLVQALIVRFGERCSKLHILDSRLLPLIL